jgi:LysM repeat protein
MGARNATRGMAALVAVGVGLLLPPGAGAAVPHVVQPGESLFSIATAYNFTARTIAVYNGLSIDSALLPGSTVQIPTEAEGAAALVAAGITPGVTPLSVGLDGTGAPSSTSSSSSTSTTSTSATTATSSAPAAPPAPTAADLSWVVPLSGGPAGTFYLAPGAAESFQAMREASQAAYGIDLYPGGPLSAFRTYAQQSYLYQLFLSGAGAPANAPGSSTHELGVAVDLADPAMRDVVDQIGPTYGWYATIPSEWWHVQYMGG